MNNAVGIPRGPVDYDSKAWMDVTMHAAKELERLGLDYMVHNSPGYSGCGGPWVTPEMSMPQLVWTESLVTEDSDIHIASPRPYAKHGYYNDAFVVAYPSLPVETMLMKESLSAIWINGEKGDKNTLTDGNPESKIRLDAASDRAAVVIMEFSQPFKARSITILRTPEEPKDLFDGPRDYPPVFYLESSQDGQDFQLSALSICLICVK